MAEPVTPKPAEVDYWERKDGSPARLFVIGGPEEGPDVIPCPALVNPNGPLVHVAYKLNEIELAALARGGTLWLTTWGALPIHLISVTDRDGNGSVLDGDA